MKKLIAAIFVLTAMAISQGTFALDSNDIHPDWVPTGWQKLAEGTIENVSNMGPYNIDSFSVKINGVTMYFHTDAPVSTTDSVKRAFGMALTFWARSTVVKIYGTDNLNAIQINMAE